MGFIKYGAAIIVLCFLGQQVSALNNPFSNDLSIASIIAQIRENPRLMATMGSNSADSAIIKQLLEYEREKDEEKRFTKWAIIVGCSVAVVGLIAFLCRNKIARAFSDDPPPESYRQQGGYDPAEGAAESFAQTAAYAQAAAESAAGAREDIAGLRAEVMSAMADLAARMQRIPGAAGGAPAAVPAAAR